MMGLPCATAPRPRMNPICDTRRRFAYKFVDTDLARQVNSKGLGDQTMRDSSNLPRMTHLINRQESRNVGCRL